MHFSHWLQCLVWAYDFSVLLLPLRRMAEMFLQGLSNKWELQSVRWRYRCGPITLAPGRLKGTNCTHKHKKRPGMSTSIFYFLPALGGDWEGWEVHNSALPVLQQNNHKWRMIYLGRNQGNYFAIVVLATPQEEKGTWTTAPQCCITNEIIIPIFSNCTYVRYR